MSKLLSLQDMLAAARLTRAGRLQEAASLLQRSLRGKGATGATSNVAPADGDVIDIPFKEVEGTTAPERTALGEPPWGETTSQPGARVDADARAEPAASIRATQTARAMHAASSAVESALQALRTARAPNNDHTTRAPHDAVDHGPGRFIRGSFTNAAGTREYRLYVPTSHAGEAMPLIVMLHGCKQSPEDFAAGTRMNLIAEKKGCLVLYPAQSTQANPSGCWNWFKREEQAHGRGEPSILAGMVREVMAHWAVDAGRVSVAGLSAGGAMAAVLAVTYPELFAAVGIHSGLACGAAQDLPSALAAMRGMPPMPLASDSSAAGAPMPTIVFHGDRDHTVHPSNGEQVGEHVLRAASAKHGTAGAATEERGQAPGGHPYTRTMHRDAAGNAVLEHWVVHGGGHAWFGGSTAGSYCDPRGPDASEEISRFLLARARADVHDAMGAK